MKKTVWLAIAFAVVVVGMVVLSTFRQDRVRCQVCITFKGQRDCRVASATTQQEAVRAGTSNACAQLASGVTETTQCENTQPDSVEWLR
jgi:heme exporter protein D